MLSLDQLVKIRNLMQSVDFGTMRQRAFKDFESSLDPARALDIVHNLTGSLDVVAQALDAYGNEYAQTIAHVDQLIQSQIPVYLQKSVVIDRESAGANNETVLQRKLLILGEDQAWFAHRLHVLSSWQTPALVVRPSELWFNDLVSNDPLYIVDRNLELLKPCQAGYHEVYRRRLREYTINDYQENFLTDQLPIGQFGLVFAWNYFEMRTANVLEKYIQQVSQLLRPGGHFVFTYNNCDHENGIRLIDNHSGTYVDSAIVKRMAQQHGLLVSNVRYNSNVAWVELKKPGEIVSLRGGQNLAKIVVKSK